MFPTNSHLEKDLGSLDGSLGVPYGPIYVEKEKHMGKVSEEKLDRNAEIYLRRKSGEGPKSLGEEYDLSPNRIWKIVTQYEKRHVNAEV